MRLFANETFQLIEEPRIKKVLEEIDFGSYMDSLPEEVQRTLEAIGKLPLREVEELIISRPLVKYWKDGATRQSVTPVNERTSDKPKQKGRYRLTKAEIKFRKQKVKEAKKMKKENPQKQWKEIDIEFANEIGTISDRTFRDWRHTHYS